MRLGSNITALTISTQMKKTNRYATASSLRLSSGVKINSAKDDPAGMAIVNRIDTINRQSEKNKENYSDGISLTQTVDGYLATVNDMLQRMRELSVQAANGTLANSDREKIQVEIDQLKQEIESTSKNAQFNGIKFLSGDSSRLNYPSNPNLTDYNYVSGAVPEGILKYDIVSMGEPALLDAYVEATPPTNVVGQAGEISINGYLIEVSADNTYAEVNDMIKKACDATNIEYFPDRLVTRGEGVDETITISCDPSGFFPIVETGTNPPIGTDAVITTPKLYEAPDGTVEIASFNNGLSVDIDGNSIRLSGTNNQVIDIDLAFKLADDGTYLYGSTGPAGTAGSEGGAIWSATAPTGVSESTKVLNSGQLKIQSGIDSSANISIYFREINLETLGLEDVNLGSQLGASKALEEIDAAMNDLLSYRAEIGAYTNRMSNANTALDDATVNMETYMSVLRDTDVAYEMSFYSNQNIKMQAAISVLAQANQRPQQILSLLN